MVTGERQEPVLWQGPAGHLQWSSCHSAPEQRILWEEAPGNHKSVELEVFIKLLLHAKALGLGLGIKGEKK